ncbi:MAG: UDP-N-acetyl-D-mannosamine dehydrogenase [Planctomycetota bacterium]|nr:MAG: UDP-N-acetyl-D-mannosamine dehydrogenase [Planctomycetota bacterium]
MRRIDEVMVYGLGYVGLPTAALMATAGYRVYGYDTNSEIIKTLKEGDVHIEEAGLKTLLRAAIESGNLKVVSEPRQSDAHIICVPTPVVDGRADLSAVKKVSETIAGLIRRGDLVVLESTVPPRTTETVVAEIIRRKSGLTAGRDFYLAYCPERVLPGKILSELVHNDRLIGGFDKESAQVAASLYSRFVDGALIKCGCLEAEIAKLAENTYRDVNIAFANELARICHSLNADVWRVIDLANRHPRVSILRPGAGVGGHCIPVDPWMLTGFTRTHLIQAARHINDTQPHFIANSIAEILNPESRVVLLGLTYKENVDDTRNAPSEVLADALSQKGFSMRFCDPYVRKFRGEEVFASVVEAAQDADMLLFVVAHDEWLRLAPAELAKIMRRRLVYDATGKVDSAVWRSQGFEFHGLARRK